MEKYKERVIGNIDKSIETQEQLIINAKEFRNKVVKVKSRDQYSNILKKYEKLLFRPLWFTLEHEDNYMG